MADEPRMIGDECYICWWSQRELVSADNTKRVHLEPVEYNILSFFIDHANQFVSLEQIAAHIWGPNYEADNKNPDSIRGDISRTRKKMDKIESGLGMKRIVTIPKKKKYTTTYTLVTKSTPEPNHPGTAAPSLSCVFQRGRDEPRDVFVLPAHYITPESPFQQLVDTAFLKCKIHAISGQRGMGKSELARYFARWCCEGSAHRDALKYDTVIWTTYSERGLEDTIAKLDCSEEAADDQPYRAKLRLLSEAKKPCLLVIDNYDNETSFAEELSSSSPVYKDLLRCGCHILLTSRVDLSDCRTIDQTEMTHFPESHLNGMFWTLSAEDKTEDNQKKAAELIKKYLDFNTYLVILAAKLTETSSLDDILKAFKELSVAKMTDPISTEKDGARQRPASLLSQYTTMFSLSSVQNDRNKTRLLYNLALLPIDGMPYKDFFEFSFPPEEREAMQQACSQLKDSFWVFLRSRQVCIHPMIREMVISALNCFDYAYIQQYIRSLNDRLADENYTDRTRFNLKYAAAAYEACEKLSANDPDIIKLVSGMAATYDLVKNADDTYYYSKRAIQLLQAVEANHSVDDASTIASCYNMVGYAILHAYNKQDSKELAEQALLRAKSIADGLAGDHQEDAYSVILRTKIDGNLAALYIAKKEYEAALELHKEALRVRGQLVKDSPSPDAKLLLAAAYKGIATDFFYLSKQRKQSDELFAQLLQSSMENHRRAAALYEEVLSANSLEACTANNRLVSTGIYCLTYAAGPERIDIQETIAEYIDKTLSIAQYLCSIEPVAHEISICISNAESLAKYLDDIKCYDKELLHKLEETAQLVLDIVPDTKSEWSKSIKAICRVAPMEAAIDRTGALPVIGR